MALVTDHLFRNEAAIGWSLALVLGLSQPLLALSLFASRRALARVEASA